MIIYDNTGAVLLDIEVDDTSVRYKAIKGENSLTLKFSLAEHVEVPLGSYCVFKGETYSLMMPEDLTMNHRRSFEYTLVMYSEDARAKRYVFVNPVDGRVKFSLTAKPVEHLQMFVDNMNMRDAGWSVGECPDHVEIVLSYNRTKCHDALVQLADELDLDYWFNGKVVNIGKLELNKDNPLPLSYGGDGEGLKPNVKRTNYSDALPLEVLFVQGTETNIDASKYGASELHLPKGQTIRFDGTYFEDEEGFDDSKARSYKTDEKGYSVTRADKEISNHSEDSLDCSDIEPTKEEVVSAVIEVSKDKHFYDILFASNVDYSQYVIGGENATVVFQSGMLAGKEFDLATDSNGNLICKKEEDLWRVEIVPQDIDGITMPDAESGYVPVADDTFKVFGVQLPDEYISDNDTKSGAEWDMFRFAVKHFYANEDVQYTVSGELDEIYAKRNWDAIKDRVVLGSYISFSDSSFQTEPLLIRITGIKEYVNRPYSPQLEISNATLSGTLVGTLNRIENQEVQTEDMVRQAIGFSKRRWRDAKETISMLSGALSNFSESINPVTVETMTMLVGDERLQFVFTDAIDSDSHADLIYSYDASTGIFSVSSTFIKHMTLGIDSISPVHTEDEYKRWSVNEVSEVLDKQSGYYLYAKVAKDNTTGTFEMHGSVQSDTDEHYYLLVGILNSEYDGDRSFAPLYGYTEVRPGQITTDNIRSSDGKTWLDLLKGILHLNDMAGVSGVKESSKGDKSIAAWFGGLMKDIELDADKENAAKSVIRHDGTGYFAEGLFSWDKDNGINLGNGQLKINYDSSVEFGGNIRIGNTGEETLDSLLTIVAGLAEMWYFENGVVKSKYPIMARGYAAGATATSAGVSGYGMTSIVIGEGNYTPDELGVVNLSPAFSDFYTKYEVNELIDRITAGDIDLANYYTKEQIDDKGFLTSASLVGYATQGYVSEQIREIDLSPYAKIEDVAGAYATKQKLAIEAQRIDTLESYFSTSADADAQINKWNEIVSFLNATEGTTLAGILAAYTLKSDLGALAYLDGLSYSDVGVTKDVVTSLIGPATYAPYNASGYLPLSGGTLRLQQFSHFRIDSQDAEISRSAIVFSINNVFGAQIGWDKYDNRGTYLYNYSSNSYLGIKNDDGTPYWNNHTLLHSGNVGDFALPIIEGVPHVIFGGWPNIEYYNGPNLWGRIGFSSKGVAAIHNTSQWRAILHEGNIGDYALKTNGSNKMGASAYINWATAEGEEDYSAYNDGIRLLGYNPTTGNYMGGIHIGTRYGWQIVRDGYTGAVRVRYHEMTTSSWSAWKNIAFTSDLDNYLPLSGGTMNENATIHWGANNTEDYTTFQSGFRLLQYNTAASQYRGGIHVGTYYGWQMTRTNQVNVLQFRGYDRDNAQWSDWKTIAFTDSDITGKSGGIIGQHSTTSAVPSMSTGELSYIYNIHKGINGIFDSNSNANSLLTVSRHSGGYLSQLGFSGNGNLYYRSVNAGEDLVSRSWKTIAFTDSNVASAQALKHSNGTVGATVGTNGIILVSGYGVAATDGRWKLSTAGYNGDFGTTNSSGVELYSLNGVLLSVGGKGLILNSSGNVTIGGSDLAGTSAKLYVGGATRIISNVIIGSSSLENGRLKIVGADTSSLTPALYVMSASGIPILDVRNGGNVLIGSTTDDGAKLQVNGGISIASGYTLKIGDATISYVNGVLKVDKPFMSKGYVAGATASVSSGEGGVILNKDSVIEALGYTPYDSANPNGYITTSALSGYQLSSGLGSLAYKSSLVASDIPDLSGTYLPKSGGIIDGGTDQAPIVLKGTGATLRIGFKKNNAVLGYLGFAETNKPLYLDSAGNGFPLIHSGNVGEYALPLKGGTITGAFGALTIKRHSEHASGIKYENNNGVLGYLGFNGSEPYFWGENLANANALLHSGNVGSYKAGDSAALNGLSHLYYFRLFATGAYDANTISEGGIYRMGSESGGSVNWPLAASYGNVIHAKVPSADTAFQIAAPHYASQRLFFRSFSNSTQATQAWKEFAFTDQVLSLDGSNARATKLTSSESLDNYKYGFYSYTNGNNPTNSYGDNTALFAFTSHRGNDTWQIAFDGNGINNTWGPVVGIRGNYAGQGWTSWYRIATTKSNVASATKLQTARTIWEQSFDGTSDVEGDLGIKWSKIYWNKDVNNYYIGWNSSEYAFDFVNYYGHRFHSKGSERMRITSDGNVLIGTTEDNGAKLQVNGSVDIGFNAIGRALSEKWTDGNGSKHPWYGLDFSTAGTCAYLSNYFGLHLKTYLGDLYISSNGNVGIGTTAPQYKLDVAGNVGISSANGLIDIANGQIKGNATLTIGVIGTFCARIQTSHYSTGYTCPLIINPNGGNVLIGAVSDNGARLQVNGNISTTTSIKIGDATLTWDDTNKVLKCDKPIMTTGYIAGATATTN